MNGIPIPRAIWPPPIGMVWPFLPKERTDLTLNVPKLKGTRLGPNSLPNQTSVKKTAGELGEAIATWLGSGGGG